MYVVGAVACEPVELVHDAELAPRVAVMNASMSCNPSRSADRADSPESMNSRMTSAPRSSALRRFASRWAGIEKPSSVPPRSACSRVETHRCDTANAAVGSSDTGSWQADLWW